MREGRRFTMWLRLLVALTCLFISTPYFAHSAEQHVLGTIMAIDATHVEIRTTMGQSIHLQVNKKTRYKDESNPKKATMPAGQGLNDLGWALFTSLCGGR